MGGGFTAAPSVFKGKIMAKQDPCEGAAKELFIVSCVELEDTFFRSMLEVEQGCVFADCDNKERCDRPDPLRYVLDGPVKREG